MELNVGNYVRTTWGYICKIININEFREPCMKYGVEASYLKDIMFIGDEDIIKSSPNIIDILEEHDFVQMEDRGHRFYEIEKDYTDKLSLIDIGWDEYEELNETNIPEIVSIVTHEQMEQMKYKVN